MKKLLCLMILGLFIISMIGVVSATVPICSTYETTFVSGTITDQSTSLPIPGADVSVTCNSITKTATSNINGGYSAQYTAVECPDDSTVTVFATNNDDLSGSSNSVSWYNQNSQIGCLELIVNVACADVEMTPEFGLIMGTLTLFGAIGIFFFVRRG